MYDEDKCGTREDETHHHAQPHLFPPTLLLDGLIKNDIQEDL
jgi:hypothetical protein